MIANRLKITLKAFVVERPKGSFEPNQRPKSYFGAFRASSQEKMFHE
jgi:hypothetical protein